MALEESPDHSTVTEDDIVALGGTLEPATMLAAYRQGIFPWPVEDYPVLPWFSPQRRAVLDFKDLHIPRSLARFRKKMPYYFTIDRAFERVIRYCAEVARPDQGTWITATVIESCILLHQEGHAHSVEAWEKVDDREYLVGGVYGIAVAGYFSGESMFHMKPNASKLALLHLIEHLAAKGLDWIDIQVMTPHMRALGARLIAKPQFLKRLAQARERESDLFSLIGR